MGVRWYAGAALAMSLTACSAGSPAPEVVPAPRQVHGAETYGVRVVPDHAPVPGDEAARQVLERMSPDGVVDAEVVGFQPGAPSPHTLRAEVRTAGPAPASLLAQWKGDLALAAVAELMHGDEHSINEVVDRESVIALRPDGRRQDLGGGVGAAATGLAFADQTAHTSDDVLRSRATQALGRFGLTVTSVAVLHPLGPAVAVVATVPDGDVDWTMSDLQDAVEGTVPTFEGLYLQLDGPDGAPLAASERTSRLAGGGVWFAPGQDDRFGITHSGMPHL